MWSDLKRIDINSKQQVIDGLKSILDVSDHLRESIVRDWMDFAKTNGGIDSKLIPSDAELGLKFITPQNGKEFIKSLFPLWQANKDLSNEEFLKVITAQKAFQTLRSILDITFNLDKPFFDQAVDHLMSLGSETKSEEREVLSEIELTLSVVLTHFDPYHTIGQQILFSELIDKQPELWKKLAIAAITSLQNGRPLEILYFTYLSQGKYDIDKWPVEVQDAFYRRMTQLIESANIYFLWIVGDILNSHPPAQWLAQQISPLQNRFKEKLGSLLLDGIETEENFSSLASIFTFRFTHDWKDLIQKYLRSEFNERLERIRIQDKSKLDRPFRPFETILRQSFASDWDEEKKKLEEMKPSEN